MAELELDKILGSLSEKDIEKLRETASSLLGGLGATTEKPSENSGAEQVQAAISANTAENALSSLGVPNLEMISSLMPVLEAFNAHDDRVDFINSLKPLLSESKRKKADEASRLLKLLSLVPILKERGIM